ncbi:bifunctional histidinol-phosphatase/imidazoleglycerol-phosphate dehydratase HisB [Membranihabitans maritimus]|uniref:bifunctional histidinol-phosphatase/imidazoleglycerol-phosphate dehydratase HisB n=1 Tax=Membranihabitans maritimus TaxID=2904244 RepID=UPI001F016FF7|nr:bifunctional histidinol-phosphatase/imidazoleglycerol-phosphate dehydratase HisB [Membranihabitans maritimus]
MNKKKLLFIDRDGVLLTEPPEDYQVDSFEKFEIVPGCISALVDIVATKNYELVMVTNQDGLGTDSFPESTFWGPQNLLVTTLKNEGINFREVHIDRSFASENKDTRKPGIGMLKHFLNGDYDLENSFVIGDRYTDILLAKNLGAKGILLGKSADESEDGSLEDHEIIHTLLLKAQSWKEIRDYLVAIPRKVKHQRNTNETRIQIELNLDGRGSATIHTGIRFFDHMLDQIARHGGIDLKIQVDGDLDIDEHHTIEDTGLALGEAFTKAIGSKVGMARYGFALPMDDCKAQVLIDFGGRPWFIWEAEFQREMVGKMPTEMFSHFFKSFSDTAGVNLQVFAEGENEHHKIEAIFKSFARALKSAVKRDVNDLTLASTKGSL